MIRYLTHELIDKNAWDRCILNAGNGMIFGAGFFLDEAYPHWNAVVKGDYEAVMMVPVKQKLHVLYALNPFFVRHVGIFASVTLSETQKLEMLNAIPNTIKLVKLFVEPLEISGKNGWTTQERVYQLLKLSGSPDVVEKKFSTNTRRNIKKAEKHELHLFREHDPSVVTEIFRKYKGAELEVFSDDDYNRLNRVMKSCMQHDAGDVWSVKDPHGNTLAAGFFCKWKTTVTFLKGAVTDEGKNVGAMHFLFSKVIKHYHPEFDVLDFGGSNVASVARFYKSLGGEDVNYVQIERDTLPGIVKMLRRKK